MIEVRPPGMHTPIIGGPKKDWHGVNETLAVSSFVNEAMAAHGGFTTQKFVFELGTAGKDEDSWAKQCHKSGEVQKAVASLVSYSLVSLSSREQHGALTWRGLILTSLQATMLTLMMGVLSALTTGWWGAHGDRHGRKRIIFLALLGMVLMDSVFLL